MADKPRWKNLVGQLQAILDDEKEDNVQLGAVLRGENPADIALVINELQPKEVDRIFDALNNDCKANVLTKLDPSLSQKIIERLDLSQSTHLVDKLSSRDVAKVIAQAPTEDVVEAAADRAQDPEIKAETQPRLEYPPGSAGRLMTQNFIALHPDMSMVRVMDVIRGAEQSGVLSNLYVVDNEKNHKGKYFRLQGVISIRQILTAKPEQTVKELMTTNFVSVKGDTPESDAANLLAVHRFLSLPVLDEKECLLGVIPSDDLMRGAIARLHRRYSTAVGTDAAAMEEASPLTAAKMRVPWLLLTIFLELIAGTVISHFDGILKQVILLASFMPVISAVSGNVGLQAAAITVRGLDTQQEGMKTLGKSLLKEAATAILMALVCAIVLGVVGLVWSRDFSFSLVIGGALGCSMLTAGLMGTIIPMVSKKLGFDPAATAGPFETAFQDIIGFGVFLGLATLLLSSMH